MIPEKIDPEDVHPLDVPLGGYSNFWAQNLIKIVSNYREIRFPNRSINGNAVVPKWPLNRENAIQVG